MSSNRFGSARRSLAMTPSKLTLDHKINMFEKGENLNSKPDRAVNASQARILECRLNRMNSMGVLESDTPDKRSHVIGAKLEQALSSKSCTSLFTKASGNSLPGSESELEKVSCRRKQPTKIIAQESTPFTMKAKRNSSLASTLSNVSHVESRNNSYNPPPENDIFKRPFEPKVREDDSGSTIDLMMSKININLEFSDDEEEKKDIEEPRLSEAASEIACAMGVVADDYINGLLDVEKEVSKESSESSLKEDKGEKNDIGRAERKITFTTPIRYV